MCRSGFGVSVTNHVFKAVVTKVTLPGTSRKPVMDIASDFDLLVEDCFNQAMTLEKERKLTLLKQSITLRKDL